MAASIAALYPNSDASSSAKKRGYTLDEIKTIVAHSGAPPTVVAVTLAALSARGEWPREDGPATTILSVALKGIMFDSVPSCCRRTAQRRIKRALKDEYWRSARDAHSWTDCPKCGKQRNAGKCQGCGYRGRSKDASGNWTGEFMRVPTYEFDIEKFRRAPRCKELRHFDARTYAEYKEAAERGEHPNVREFPSPPRNDPPPPKPPAPAAPQREEPRRKTAEHQRVEHSITTQITSDATKAAQHVFEFCGLADIGLIAKIAIGIVAEAKFQGIGMEDAAKYIAETAVRQQKSGVTLNGFYWRDLKWRTHGGGQQASAAQERSERIDQAIINSFARRIGPPNETDG
jgi:hypothetical protein